MMIVLVTHEGGGVYIFYTQLGPASLLESDLTSFRNWYLALMGPPERLEHLSPNPEARFFGF